MSTMLHYYLRRRPLPRSPRQRRRPRSPPYGLLLAPPIVDPAAVLAIIQPIDAAATLVCNEIDEALELEHEARTILKDLRKETENIKSGLMTVEFFLIAIKVDAGFTSVQALYVM